MLRNTGLYLLDMADGIQILFHYYLKAIESG